MRHGATLLSYAAPRHSLESGNLLGLGSGTGAPLEVGGVAVVGEFAPVDVAQLDGGLERGASPAAKPDIRNLTTPPARDIVRIIRHVPLWGCVVSTGDLLGRIAGRVRRTLDNQTAKHQLPTNLSLWLPRQRSHAPGSQLRRPPRAPYSRGPVAPTPLRAT